MDLLPLGVAVLSTLSAVASQQTWTVAPTGAQFTNIAAAVAAAASGDVILVGPGPYAPFVVNGKGLTILGQQALVLTSGAGPGPVAPSITIENLTAGQRVQIAGLSAMHLVPAPAALLVRNCAGGVWIQDAFVDSFGAEAIVVENSADVVLVGCIGQANRGAVLANGTPVAMAGARFAGSSVRAYDSEFRGSTGVLQGTGFPAIAAAPDGGHGLHVLDSQVALDGGRFVGGAGGLFLTPTCTFAGNGGDGVRLSTAGGTLPLVRSRDPQLQAGVVGQATCGPTPQPGLMVRMVAGLFVLDAGSRRRLNSPASVVGPAALPVEIVGRPQDLAFVFAGFPAPTAVQLGLPVHIDLGLPVVTLGSAALGPTGRATLQVPMPGLGPALSPLGLALQALVFDAAAASASNPRTLLLR